VTRALRSLWIWFVTAACLVIGWPTMLIVRLTELYPARYRTGWTFRRIGHVIGRSNPTWRLHLGGTEHIGDPRRPYVVVSNHQSLADIPLISHVPMEMKWMAKASLFRLPLLGWMMSLAGDIPVDRADRRSGARALLAASRTLANRCSVIFFPEGTRSRDGRIGAFNEGAFLLAIKAGVPVLPIAVDGSSDCLPKHSWMFGDVQDIRLQLLPPVPTAGLATRDAGALRDRVRAAIVAQVAAWRGVPPADVDGNRGRISHNYADQRNETSA